MTQHFAASRPRAGAGFGALRLPLDFVLGLQRSVRQWQWRGARPFAHLNDHLRRDVGLPPLDPGTRWW